MNREEYLESCLQGLLDEINRVIQEKERRGGQHVPCRSRLMGCPAPVLTYLKNEVTRAVDNDYFEELEKPKTEITHYVLGFVFCDKGKKVLLIKKNRPYWQAGKLNGIGGKIEAGETPLQAMTREFNEETTLFSVENDWKKFCVMAGKHFVVHCFTSKNDNAQVNTTNLSRTDEIVSVYDVAKVEKQECMSNIPWLVKMAKDCDAISSPLVIKYGEENV